MRDFLIIVTIFVVLFLGALMFIDKRTDEEIGQVNQVVLFDKINSWKTTEHGYSYIESDELCRLASQRVMEIKTNWSHSGFKAVAEKGKSFGFLSMAENLSKEQLDEATILSMWLNSPNHKANLVSLAFNYSCVRCEEHYCVHLFGLK